MEEARAQFLEAVQKTGSLPITQNLRGRTEIGTGKPYFFVPCADGKLFWAYVDNPSAVKAI